MRLLPIAISIKGNRGEVVLVDQAHDPASSRRVALEFPLPLKPETGFSNREEQVIREARAVIAAALIALDEL
ncbi:hypothetical protein [Methylobacterium nigriterrae]|uniref:hypothetical protein n=1 Tax=Methylobacterium nigriterrae TaxID=3127512 RepID=UPI003013DE1C